MRLGFDIKWDDYPHANQEQVEEHGVSQDEAEFVIREYFSRRQPGRSRPDLWIVQGYSASNPFWW